MKIVNSNLDSQPFWVLTVQHLMALKSSSIGFDSLPKLTEFCQVIAGETIKHGLAPDDLIDMAVLRYRCLTALGIEVNNLLPCELSPDPLHNDLLHSKIKSKISECSKPEHIQALKEYPGYYVGSFNGISILVASDETDYSKDYISKYGAGLTRIEVGNFKSAMVKAFYHIYGYEFLHFHDREIQLQNDEITLTKLFRAIA